MSSTGWEIASKIIKHWSLKKVVNCLAWDQNVTKWKYRHLLSLKITTYFTCLKQIQKKIRLPCELFCLLQSSLWIKWQLSKILWGYVHFAQYFQGYYWFLFRFSQFKFWEFSPCSLIRSFACCVNEKLYFLLSSCQIFCRLFCAVRLQLPL